MSADHEGDAIYMPPGYWHCVSGEGLNIAVSQFWKVTRREWITNPVMRALAWMRIRTKLPKPLSSSRGGGNDDGARGGY